VRKNDLTHETEYVEGLEGFLESSAEDAVDIDGILEQFPTFAGSTFNDLKSRGSGRVLDIGSGNGAKAINFARKLFDLDVSVVVDSVEPKAKQRECLVKNYQGENKEFFGFVFDKPFDETTITRRYDFVLVIHSLYEFPRNEYGEILSLNLLDKTMSEGGAGVIIIEHPDGDLQRMKREMYPLFEKKSPVSQDLVTRCLEKSHIPFKVGGKIEFSFSLDSIINNREDDIGKALSFLFSDSLDNRCLTSREFAAIGQWIKRNVRVDYKNNSYLLTPDISIWIFNR
jgi:SAM-dependent methyltransferase